MEAMDAILSRRSIRRYTPEQIPEIVLVDLLKAAMNAPSANNEQPWHFVVINDRKILEEITKLHPYSYMLKEAPLAITVCGDCRFEFWIQDCSAATENVLIAANAKGLGAVWLGVYPIESRVMAIKKLFEMPKKIVPLSIISIGYPAEEKPRVNRYNSKVIHYNHW